LDLFSIETRVILFAEENMLIFFFNVSNTVGYLANAGS